MQRESHSAMADAKLMEALSIAQKEALLELGSRGPGARLDMQALFGLVDAGMVEVDDARRTALTARGQMAYALLTADD